MIVTPVTRRLEIARPDTEPSAAGGRLLDLVPPRGDRQSFSHHGSTKIAAGNLTGGQQAIILVHVFRAAIGGTGQKQLRQAVARDAPARPWPAIGIGALLRQLGRIKAQQPDAVIAKSEAVAVAGTAQPRNRRRWLIEGGRDHRSKGEQADG